MERAQLCAQGAVCARGAECYACTALGALRAGTVFNFDVCILCFYLAHPDKYCMVPDEYPTDYIDARTWKRVLAPTQFAHPHELHVEGPVYPQTWCTYLFDVELCASCTHTPSCILVCEEHGVLNTLDVRKAVGSARTVLDLATDTVRCVQCARATHVRAHHEDLRMCAFCGTYVGCKQVEVYPIPYCSDCAKYYSKLSEDTKRVCLYCGDHVNARVLYPIRVRQEEEIKDAFLCKKHKIFSYNKERIYNIDEIFSRIRESAYIKTANEA